MGKKGLGRKAFVKAAMATPLGPQPESEAEAEPAAPGPAPPPEASEAPTNGEAAHSNSIPEGHTNERAAAAPPAAEVFEVPDNETRGQLVQRQKRARAWGAVAAA